MLLVRFGALSAIISLGTISASLSKIPVAINVRSLIVPQILEALFFFPFKLHFLSVVQARYVLLFGLSCFIFISFLQPHLCQPIPQPRQHWIQATSLTYAYCSAGSLIH